MMDFRRVDIAKQKAYDLLRDWIKLVARHTNPDQDISELLGWLWKLEPQTPDPITGLVPCGCGERVSISFYPGWAGTPDFYQVDCFSCHVGTRRCQTAEQAKAAWNTAMGWRVEE